MHRPMRPSTGLACLLALGACAAESSIDDLTLAELLPDAEVDAQLTGQALASGTLRLNDVYYVPARSGETDAPMYASASSSSIVRRIPQEAALKIVIAAPSSN